MRAAGGIRICTDMYGGVRRNNYKIRGRLLSVPIRTAGVLRRRIRTHPYHRRGMSAALNKFSACLKAASAAEPPGNRALCAPLFDGSPPLPPTSGVNPSKSDPSEGPGSVTRIHKSFKRQKNIGMNLIFCYFACIFRNQRNPWRNAIYEEHPCCIAVSCGGQCCCT